MGLQKVRQSAPVRAPAEVPDQRPEDAAVQAAWPSQADVPQHVADARPLRQSIRSTMGVREGQHQCGGPTGHSDLRVECNQVQDGPPVAVGPSDNRARPRIVPLELSSSRAQPVGLVELRG